MQGNKLYKNIIPILDIDFFIIKQLNEMTASLLKWLFGKILFSRLITVNDRYVTVKFLLFLIY